MDGARFIERIRIKNLLSFGSEGIDLRLEPLNVLIGPNGSGKSNLIEAMGLLRSAPGDIAATIRRGGGIDTWLWKGTAAPPVAEIDATISLPIVQQTRSLRYWLHFTSTGQRFEIQREGLTEGASNHNNGRADYLERLEGTSAALHLPPKQRSPQQAWEAIFLAPEESAISQIRHPSTYPELTSVRDLLRKILMYRESEPKVFGPLRQPQKVDLPNDYLLEDASNLCLMLNQLEYWGLKRRVVETLQRFYELATDYYILIQGGTSQFFLRESSLAQPIPAARLSDGTLRYLCLLAILLHPSPPPLICIEEPELGMHPDILPTIAELLVGASQRTQLIVTTHSDRLISALSDHPEAIVVCERDEAGTRLERLDPKQMKEWLAKYSLGTLWSMGEIGGNRW